MKVKQSLLVYNYRGNKESRNAGLRAKKGGAKILSSTAYCTAAAKGLSGKTTSAIVKQEKKDSAHYCCCCF